MTLTFEMDTKAFEAALSKHASETLPAMVDRGLYKWGEATMREIKGDPRVPVMDGPLRSSGVVLPVARNGTLHTLTMGFGGPAAEYAVSVHENPRSGKTHGRSPWGRLYKKWAKVGAYKFLERPMAERGPKIPETIVAEAR